MVAAQHEVPLVAEMNTTPLIDVMLVLLVMFIITIPAQTHSVKLDLPQGPPPLFHPKQVSNEIDITAQGAILWNGVSVTRSTLAWDLEATTAMSPQPELHLRPDANARYEIVDEVLAAAKRAGVARMGFVGNERYQNF